MLGRVQASTFINLPQLKKNLPSNPSANTAHVFLKQGTTQRPIGNIAFGTRHGIFPREAYVMPETHFALVLYYTVINSIYFFFFLWHFSVIITFLFKQLDP